MVLCYSSNRKTETHSGIGCTTSARVLLARTCHGTTPQLRSLGNVVHNLWATSSPGDLHSMGFLVDAGSSLPSRALPENVTVKNLSKSLTTGGLSSETLWFNIQASNTTGNSTVWNFLGVVSQDFHRPGGQEEHCVIMSNNSMACHTMLSPYRKKPGPLRFCT